MEDILHKCGHIEERYLRGRGAKAKAESKVWWEEQNCKECWKKEKQTEADEYNKVLPELSGSEKQVNWAMMLRVNSLKRVESVLTESGILNNPELKEKALEKLNILRRVVSAKFWIETREELGEQILAHVGNDSTVTTVWFARPVKVPSRSWRGYTYVGGTKPHYTEHELAAAE